MAVNKNKRAVKKQMDKTICEIDRWVFRSGYLKGTRGRPDNTQRLVSAVAEKLPYESLDKIKEACTKENLKFDGVYVAHDSMGWPRYIGRGDVFDRLQKRKDAHPHELHFFSFWLTQFKKHERELETMLIHVAGPILHFNERKRREDLKAGDPKDYEFGTFLFERQDKRGKKKK